MTPPLSSLTVATSGVGSAAAASNAAILGPAAAASLDQPAVSRILANLIAIVRAVSDATSDNNAASCVQPTVSALSSAAIARKRSNSGPHRCRAVRISLLLQPR